MKAVCYLFLCLFACSANAAQWELVFHDQGTDDWTKNWFLEGAKAKVNSTKNGMVFSAGPTVNENASHAVLWTNRNFHGDIKVEYDYTRLDTNKGVGVNILYLQATGLGKKESPQDIFQTTGQRVEPWMKHYFLNMNSLHVSYATNRRYVSARRYPAKDLKSFQTVTQIQPVYQDIDLFDPDETWHITATKVGNQLQFVAERNGKSHKFEWDTSAFPLVTEGRIGFRHMWTRVSRYSNIRIYEKQRRPNVLAIILDDAGWKDVGYHGGDIATPEIDRLAKSGIRLENFYAYSTCTPTRAAFFTGHAPSRSGIVYPIQHDDHYGIPDEVTTLPEAFRNNGYRTALIGKWHLGVQPEFAPNAHGFEYQYGSLGGWTDQFTRENPVTGPDWFRNNQPLRETGHTTDLLTADAVRYLNRAGDDPFFLCLSYTAPHVPIQVDPMWAKPYEGRFDTRTRAGYAGMMSQLDHSIGQVIQTLDARHMLENTLLVVFSDNGPSEPGKKWYIPEETHKIHFYGNDGVYGDVGQLRGWKATPYEGGVKVPAFLYWKGHLSSGDFDSPVIVEDLNHSILSLVGIQDPKAGRDIFATSDQDSETFYWRTPRNLALRHDGWKLIVNNASPFETDLKTELYYLANDPTEKHDCSVSDPDQLERMLGILRSEFEKDPAPHVNPNLLDK